MAAKLVLVSFILLQLTATAFCKHNPQAGHHKHKRHGGRRGNIRPHVMAGGPGGGIPKPEPGGPAGGIPKPGTTPATPGGGATGKKWCVAKSSKQTAPLIADFQRLCKLIDCSPTGPTGMCYDESHKSKATFAMNAYYQQHGQKDSDCNYDGRAEIVTTDPSWGKCILRAN